MPTDICTTEHFEYDANGNTIYNHNQEGFRKMFWDESNRLRVVYDQNSYQMQHYIYDAAGERTLKASSQIESVYENGQVESNNTTIGLYTTYVSPYMVVDANQRYSKHYFNGTQRVASKMGEQDIIVFENMPLPIAPETEIENTPFTDFETLKTKQISDLSYYLSKSADKTTAKNFNIKFKEFKKQDTETQQITENNSAQAAPQYAELYYYHSDHLGTGTFLSDFEGNPYQFFLNLPFGETMAEQHSYSGDYTNRYKFNGKELDEETGFYYYGARYYNPKFSIWLSVDPLAEKAPNWTPYRYCFNNPVRYTDPSGLWEGDYYGRDGEYLGNDGIDDGKVYLLNEGVKKTNKSDVNWGGTLSKADAKNIKSNSEEVGGLIIQDRIEEGDDYTISEFKTVGGETNVEGFMLEPGGPSTATANQDKRIPEGVYDIENYSSKTYPDNFLLSNDEVPKSRKILYHSGNNGGNTEGCNMPGEIGKEKGQLKGGTSRPKMQELRTFIKSEGAQNVKTIINNKIPEKK